MLTLGVDFAAQPRNTAACSVRWQDSSAVVTAIELEVDDRYLREAPTVHDKVGMDVPFGWPMAFADAIARHQKHEPWPPAATEALRFRDTDRLVYERTGRWPLSVSTDRIGVTAFRASRVLPPEMDRTGTGKLVEVYPGASLRRWGLMPTKKGDSRDLLRDLSSRTRSWLIILEDAWARCAANRHAFDALVASLTARAAAVGLCEPIPAASLANAAIEGWIALPKADSLDLLAR